MIKVEGPKGPGPVQSRKTGKTERSAGAGRFAAELGRTSEADDQVESALAADGGAGIAGIHGILAAQTVSDQEQPSYEERQRRAKRGAEILDRLEEIRRGLLIGAIPKDRLADLAKLVRDKRERGADPVISRLLDEIELRAEVELAKLARRMA